MPGPRIRTLKPECWQSEKLGDVSRDARLLFVVLITLADDEGRFRRMPSLIAGHGFPYDPDAPRKVNGWLDELDATGVIRVYDVNGVPYGWFPNWSKHQRMSRHTPSELPPPPGVTRAGQDTHDGRKRPVSERLRREIAKAAGATPGDTTPTTCHFCGTVGSISWPRLANGKPGSWVQFNGLELTHRNGGSVSVESVFLACRPCHESHGHGMVTGSRNHKSRDPVL